MKGHTGRGLKVEMGTKSHGHGDGGSANCQRMRNEGMREFWM